MRMNFASSPEIRQVIHSARNEVLLALPPSDTPPRTAVDVVAAHCLAEVGVCVRIYVAAAQRGTGNLLEAELTRLARVGAEIHTTSQPVPRMTVVDRTIVVLARNQFDYTQGGLIGRDLPFTALIVRSLMAEPAVSADRGANHPAAPEPLAREVLRQLVGGVKDAAAARELGLALRTYRRIVARLMDQLGAQNRFQAGYLAAHRDWL